VTAAIVMASIWTVAWLLVLATALSRRDLDPVTRLTWVLVIILVPVFGVLVYWVVAPKAPSEVQPAAVLEPTTCVECGMSIPSGATVCPKCGWSYEVG